MDEKQRLKDEKRSRYKKAEGIRSTKLSDLLAENIAEGDGVFSSIGKTMKQKMGAKMTGIKQAFDLKEKFDPLNIINFMTGGSKLATVLAGKMLGRTGEDIHHFSGVKVHRDTASKIKPVESDDDSDIVSILVKMLEFMKKNDEEDTKHQELRKNRQEDNELRAEKRHKELLKALGAKPGEVKPTATKEDDGGGFFSFVTSLIENTFGMKITEIAGMATKLMSVISFLAPVLSMGAVVFGPAIITHFLRKSLSDDAGKSDPIENHDYTLSKPISEMKWYEKLGGAIGAKKQSIEETIERGMELNKDGRGKPLFTQKEADDIQKFYEISVPRELIKLDSASPAPAATPSKPTAAPAPSAPASPAPAPAPTTKTPAAPSSSPNLGTKLNQTTTENKSLDLDEKLAKEQVNNITNNMNIKKSAMSQSNKIEMTTVRNQEPTFRRMIYNSTRVA